jgi:hypothetical protein
VTQHNALVEPLEVRKRLVGEELGRYRAELERQRREEEDRLRREAEAEAQRKQRELELEALGKVRLEAEQEAVAAINRGQPETATEIRRVLSKFAVAEFSKFPTHDAALIQQGAELAKIHEQGRIAAAALREQGDKKAAARVEKASLEAKAPPVAPISVPRVVPTAVIVPKAAAPKGLITKKVPVIEIVDPNQIPRELLLPIDPFKAEDYPRLFKYVRDFKGNVTIPGVRITFRDDSYTRGE